MKIKERSGVLGILLLLLFSINSSAQNRELAIGAKAPMLDHEVEDVSGRSLTLNEISRSNGLLVLFSCNTCPWVMKWEDRYPVISELARTNNIGMIALNPNERYRNRGDGMEDMIKRAEKADYDFPYALDEDHVIADAFGATRTPQIYLFNSDMELVYVGAIDDNAQNAGAVNEFYLKNAVEQMVNGNEPVRPVTKSLGCSIKRVS